MTSINLLPWREQKREQEKKKFMRWLISMVIMALLLVMIINYYVSSLIEGQMHRNQRLQEEITRFNDQITEIKQLTQHQDVLISRLRIIYEMQIKRILTIHLFNELITVLPEKTYLSSIKRSKDNVILQGYSASNSEVSLLMRNIEDNAWIQEPVLNQIKKTNRKALVSNEFNLSVILKPKNTPS